ncbi:hypothetical protein GGH12_003495 [Coemansia sp. RSA 1822]|nr:hypothetical protein LPJ76_004483 [Coemansia sp. RSA 638]KAJ2125164.1 hypothetical protein IW147_001063 [Coemansia sp. RSA 720]KAJ2540423.1 hypothetical protein GGF49_004458 [Coemansia sp. RSA 1853]KAJ2562091.1 hypothetical protein GGH12_003495 [Coemansia sp. RSA 1822]
MSPPSTPRGSIFSPRQDSQMPWPFRTISLASPGKRIKLDSMLASCNSPRRLATPMSPGPGSRSVLLRSATLASRRMKRNPPTALPLDLAKLAPAVGSLGSSTGLSPVVKDLSIGISSPQMMDTKEDTPAVLVEETKPAPQPMQFRLQKVAPKVEVEAAPQPAPFRLQKTAPKEAEAAAQPMPFRLQKPAPAKKSKPMPFRLQKPAPVKESKPAPFRLQKPVEVEETQPVQPQMRFRLQKPTPTKSEKAEKAAKANKVSKLNIAPTGLISPPSVSTPSVSTPRITRGRGRPPALSLAAAPLASAGIEMSPSSPFMPQTPGAGPAPLNLIGDAMFGEASPSLYAQPTPPPVKGAPTFMFTPPSPAIVIVKSLNGDVAESESSGSLQAPAAASATLSPCTPPWPKSGSSLRKTIFDHIGQSQLSPMDLRGYMAISMNS